MVHPLPSIPRASAWLSRVSACVRQEPLVETHLSLAGLAHADAARPPRAIFLGLGLCTMAGLSKAVPLDVLGLLLPAEVIRRAAGASELLVVVADRHAVSNGFPVAAVEERARAVEEVLERIRQRCGLSALTVLRASSFHDHEGYREALTSVRQGPAASSHEYVQRQLADALYLGRRRGSLLKVGWALRGVDAFRRRDEIPFDRALRAAGGKLGFVYCKPGRALADRRPRMPPYVVECPEARLCLDRHEDTAAKLAAASRLASPSTVDGFRRHLRALVYTHNRHLDPLPRGPLEHRLEALVERLGVPAPSRAAG